MTVQQYRVGGLSSTKQRIASILGQSARACVYTTTDNELRWVYWHNKGRLTERLTETVASFNRLMPRIKALPVEAKAKRDTYELLGKSLFSALDAARPKLPETTFAAVLRHIKMHNSPSPLARARRASRRVFVVHGHDDASREALARMLQCLDLEPVILKEQANLGKTIIEKFEAESDVGFAVVLMTPDELGSTPTARPRARQNVVFELGYFSGTLGRGRVAALVKGNVEIPSDYGGVAFIPLDPDDGWRLKLGKELKAAGLKIDLNKIVV